MELNILTLLLALGNLAAGLAIGVYLRKRLVEGNQRNIALQGRQIIENAISEAEQIKKEALLHAKEEALQNAWEPANTRWSNRNGSWKD